MDSEKEAGTTLSSAAVKYPRRKIDQEFSIERISATTYWCNCSKSLWGISREIPCTKPAHAQARYINSAPHQYHSFL
jgi:hypothetical protein